MTQPTITNPGTDELTLPNHPETKVWLKRRPDFGARNLVQAHGYLTRVQVAADKYATDPVAFANYIAIRTVTMIHDWTVTDESGKRVPITIEGVNALDPEDGDFLESEARKRYEGTAGAGSTPLVTSSADTSSTATTSEPLPPSESPA